MKKLLKSPTFIVKNTIKNYTNIKRNKGSFDETPNGTFYTSFDENKNFYEANFRNKYQPDMQARKFKRDQHSNSSIYASSKFNFKQLNLCNF